MTSERWPGSVPVLTDGVVTLREHRPEDVPRMVAMCTDPEFVRWTTTPHPYTDEDARAFLHTFIPVQVASGFGMHWVIEASLGDAPPAFCGGIDVKALGEGRGDLGFGLHPAARGRGLIRRAGRLALDWAFDVAGLEVVHWHARAGNWASRYAAASMGFHFEGRLRRYRPQRGVLTDVWVGSALATEPRASAAPPRQPVLATDRVRLRPFEDRDVHRIAEACADPVSQHFLGQLPRGYSVDDARAYVEDCREGAATHSHWAWCITAPPGDACLGAITLLRLGQEAGEIGYWAHPQARGNGLVGTATRLVADHALGSGRHHSLALRIAMGNRASEAVARRAGFEPTGRHPQAQRLGDGTWADLLDFVRVAEPVAS